MKQIVRDFVLFDVRKLQSHVQTLHASSIPPELHTDVNSYLIAIEERLDSVFEDAARGLKRRVSPRLLEKEREQFTRGRKPLEECLRSL